jgi:hypothetical protein
MLPEVGGLQAPPGFILGPPLWFGFGTPRNQVHASLWLAMYAAQKNGDEPKSPPRLPWQRQCDTEPRALRSTASKQQGHIMPKDMHEKAAEHHEQTAKAHRTAAQQHGSNDHVSAKQQSAQAADKSKAAHDHSTQANNKSQQQK